MNREGEKAKSQKKNVQNIREMKKDQVRNVFRQQITRIRGKKGRGKTLLKRSKKSQTKKRAGPTSEISSSDLPSFSLIGSGIDFEFNLLSLNFRFSGVEFLVSVRVFSCRNVVDYEYQRSQAI
jgi:hypothetical protein